VTQPPSALALDKCAGCAFRPGTEAHGSPMTRTTADACVMAREPFLCHEREGLCTGWREAVKAQGEPPAWKSYLARRMLALENMSIPDRLADAAIRVVLADTDVHDDLARA